MIKEQEANNRRNIKGNYMEIRYLNYREITEGSLEVKLPTIWTDEKQRWEESEKRRRKKIQKEKVSEERDRGAREGRKVAKHSGFPMICGSGGLKTRLAKAAGVDPAGQMRDARRCGAKHISKSKCGKHFMFGGALLEVEMSKNCTPLWREANFEVKMYKTLHVRTTLGHSDVVSRGRRKRLCILSKVSKTCGFCNISKNDGRRGTFEEDLEGCIFRGRRSNYKKHVHQSG